MKKSMQWAYVIFFFTICTIPLLTWAFAATNEPVGNAPLADFPSLKAAGGQLNTKYFSEFESYFADHLPFRPYLVAIDNRFKTEIFGANSGNVITGENGFLFSEETVADYVGITASPRQIENLATTLRLTQEFVEKKGGRFLFAVAPNKNSIYDEFMPARYIKSQNTLDLLQRRLAEEEINYVDWKASLRARKGEELLYYKRDTHWNDVGALFAAYNMLDAVGKEHVVYNNLTYTKTRSFSGDLDTMLYPKLGSKDDAYNLDLPDTGFTLLRPPTDMEPQDALKVLMGPDEKIDQLIETRNPAASGSLYMLRDSFGRALLPYLIQNYQTAYITRYTPLDLLSLPEGETDVVYEIAERKLLNVLDTSPLMEAPSRKKVDPAEIKENAENRLEQENADTHLKVYGLLDPAWVEPASRIYITVTPAPNSRLDSGEKRYFEAFPICEKEALNLPEGSEYGFSARINQADLPKNYKLSVTVTHSGGNWSTGYF